MKKRGKKGERMKIEIDTSGQIQQKNYDCKSGYPKIQIPIMLCLKAKGIRTAPPGNSYKNSSSKMII